jgi:hypothetical protein
MVARPPAVRCNRFLAEEYCWRAGLGRGASSVHASGGQRMRAHLRGATAPKALLCREATRLCSGTPVWAVSLPPANFLRCLPGCCVAIAARSARERLARGAEQRETLQATPVAV